jgi:hypothetical protein
MEKHILYHVSSKVQSCTYLTVPCKIIKSENENINSGIECSDVHEIIRKKVLELFPFLKIETLQKTNNQVHHILSE